VAGKSGEIYYVYTDTPEPRVLKFSVQGQVLADFPIQGTSVDVASDFARRVLASMDPRAVGGNQVINSAAVDPQTGNLWICLNGTSIAGNVYEYSPEGVKLGEYALQSPEDPQRILLGPKDIVVNRPWIYILNEDGRVLRYNLGSALAVSLAETLVQKGPSPFVSGFYGSFSRAFRRSAAPQDKCGGTVNPGDCKQSCCPKADPSSVDCKAQLLPSIPQGWVTTAWSCSLSGGACPKTQPSCGATAVACNPANGATNNLGTSMFCNAPPKTDGDADGFALEDEPPDCNDADATWYPGAEIYSCPSAYEDRNCNNVDDRNECPDTPILLDAAGDGFALTDAAGGVLFDLNTDGTKERLAWTVPQGNDAWLVLDRNGNRRVDDGGEMFGNRTAQPSSPTPNGFLALAEFDRPENGGNGDGVIDRRDGIFSHLQLWQDRNHDGVSQSGELHRLPELGVMALRLDYKESQRVDQYGNQFRYRAKVDTTSGSGAGHWAVDVFLVRAGVPAADRNTGRQTLACRSAKTAVRARLAAGPSAW
jgi:hypothetical protein